MFCRKCGIKILDDSIFCPECGTKVENVIKPTKEEIPVPQDDIANKPLHRDGETLVIENNNNNNNDVTKQFDAETAPPTTNNGKYIKILLGVAAVIVLLIIIISSIAESGRCEYYKDCSNKKAEGSNYCHSHLCEYPDCTMSKGYSSSYCYSHRCTYTSCTSRVATGSDYCNSHTCDADGCYEQVAYDSPYCSEHQIDMRDRLGRPSMSFSLNSAGGIKFSFSATNTSGKTIKYVRFNVYLKNAVGDSIREDITNDYYTEVEIIGPIDKGDNATMSSEIIGYCDNLARIDIRDITIVYTDGTSETGSYNYYYSK